MAQPKIPGGYVLLSRKIIESEIWEKPPLYLKVWIYILAKAQHKQFKSLERGQTFISIPEIIEACSYKVGYRTERPTKKQVYGILEWLRNPNERVSEGNDEGTMIATTKVTHGMLVEVSNYGFYQNSKNYEGNNESETMVTTEEQRRERQGNNNNKNDKNVKNDKNEINTSTQIENLRQRYSANQLNVIDRYLDMIRHTRVSAKISDSVILKMYKDWDKHPPVCVEYGLKTHTDNPSYHSKKENYTMGIIRNTTSDEAQSKLNNAPPKVDDQYGNLF